MCIKFGLSPNHPLTTLPTSGCHQASVCPPPLGDAPVDEVGQSYLILILNRSPPCYFKGQITRAHPIRVDLFRLQFWDLSRIIGREAMNEIQIRRIIDGRSSVKSDRPSMSSEATISANLVESR